MKKLKRIIKNILYNNYIYRLIINSKHNRSRMKYELIKKEIENAHSHTTIGRIKRKFPYNGKIALRIIIKAYERRYEKLHSNNEYYYKAEEIGEIYELEAKIEEYKMILFDIENNTNYYYKHDYNHVGFKKSARKKFKHKLHFSSFQYALYRDKYSALLDFDEYDIPLLKYHYKEHIHKGMVAAEIKNCDKIKYRPNWMMDIFFSEQNKCVAGNKLSNIWTLSVL